MAEKKLLEQMEILKSSFWGINYEYCSVSLHHQPAPIV